MPVNGAPGHGIPTTDKRDDSASRDTGPYDAATHDAASVSAAAAYDAPRDAAHNETSAATIMDEHECHDHAHTTIPGQYH